jgi:membrane-associated phospholipid phosphatase
MAALGAAAIGVSIAFVDRPAAVFSHDLLHRPPAAVWLTYLAEVPDKLALLLLLAVGVWRLWMGRLSALWRTLLAVALATLLATFCVILLKWGFGRLWPETWVDNNPSWIRDHKFGFFPFHGGAGYRSFPSGHMARVTAPCAVVGMRYPAWRALCALPPLLVMAGLLGADFHFVSDCIAGLMLGWGCAWIVVQMA